MEILILILTILLLVVIHELGHFFACKFFDIKVLEFGFGIPPKVWGKKIGETLVSINLLPIGGFVRPLGEDEAKSEVSKENQKEWASRSFQVKPVWQRIIVVVAGVIMNLMLSFLLFWIILGVSGWRAQIPLLSDYKFFGATQKNQEAILVSNVQNNPNLKLGDRITKVNGTEVETLQTFSQTLNQNAGKEVSFTITDPEKNNPREVKVTPLENAKVSVISVGENSPAQNAGLKVNDQITKVNGKVISSSQELINEVRSQAGKEISLSILSEGETAEKVVKLTPRQNPPAGQGALGVGLQESMIEGVSYDYFPVAQLSYDEWWQKLLAGPIHSLNLGGYSLAVLFNSIGTSVQRGDIAPVSQNVSGPVGIFFVLQEILKSGNILLPLLNFVALISLSLGVMNILPFPALDGGRLPFLLIEGITKKKVPATVEARIHTAGFAILLFLILLVAYSDFQKFIF